MITSMMLRERLGVRYRARICVQLRASDTISIRGSVFLLFNIGLAIIMLLHGGINVADGRIATCRDRFVARREAETLVLRQRAVG
jgi:hypothetical protein